MSIQKVNPHSRGYVPSGNPIMDYLEQEYSRSSHNIKMQNVIGSMNSGNRDILSNLSSFLGAGNNTFSDEQWDMLYQFMLQTMLTQDQRMYDESIRDEQRAFDNPINQLSRLTGAGIGRDAAIQLLSGAGSGAGSGSSLIGSGAGLQAPSTSGISGTNANNTANTVFNGINTAINMVNCGMNANLSYQQAQLLKAQTSMAQNQLDAHQLAGGAYQLLSEGVREGVISDDNGHLYDSVANVTAGLEQLAKAGNVAAQDWHASGKIQQLKSMSPYISPLLSNMYKSERSGQDHDVWFADEHAKAESLAAVQNMQVNSLAKGIEKMDQEIQNLIADEQWRRKTIDLIDGQLKLMEAQGEQAKASAAYQKALQRKTQLENMQTNGWMSAMTDVPIQTSVGNGTIQVSGLKLFTTERLQNLKSNALVALSLNNEGYWKKNVQHQMQDVDNLISMSILDGLRTNTSLEVYNRLDDDQKQLIGLSDAYQHAGVYDYLNAYSNMNKRSVGAFTINASGVYEPTAMNGIFFPNKTGNGHK